MTTLFPRWFYIAYIPVVFAISLWVPQQWLQLEILMGFVTLSAVLRPKSKAERVPLTLREMDPGLHVTMIMVGILGGIVLVDILLPAAFQYAGRFTVALVVFHVSYAATTRRIGRLAATR